jgi:hypothetical protein
MPKMRSLHFPVTAVFLLTWLNAVSAVVINNKPTIQGVPALKVKVGVPFSFTPTASDPDGDALGSVAKWDAVKNLLGFGDYLLDDTQGTSRNAKNITSNDFMYVALSVIEQRNYSNYFAAWGISLSQAVKDQVAANGITAQVPAR